MLGDFRKNIVDRFLGTSYPVVGELEDDPLDSQTDQIESGVHGDSHICSHIKTRWSSAINTIQAGCRWIRCRRTRKYAEGEQPSQCPHTCTCPRRLCHSSIAARSEVMEVLYSPSYLSIPLVLDPEATPPPYESPPIVHSNIPNVRSPCILPRERMEFKFPVLASSSLMPCTHQGLSTPSVPSYNSPDTDSSFTDSAASSTKSPRPRLRTSGLEYPECDTDRPPAYSRFDSSRPQFPITTFNILGPYPHISILSANLA